MLSLMSRFASIYRSVPMSWDGLFWPGKEDNNLERRPGRQDSGHFQGGVTLCVHAEHPIHQILHPIGDAHRDF